MSSRHNSSSSNLIRKRSFSTPSGIQFAVRPELSIPLAKESRDDGNGSSYEQVDSPIFHLGASHEDQSDKGSSSSVFYRFTNEPLYDEGCKDTKHKRSKSTSKLLHKKEKTVYWFQAIGEAAKALTHLADNLIPLTDLLKDQAPEVLGRVTASTAAMQSMAIEFSRVCDNDVAAALESLASVGAAISNLVTDRRVEEILNCSAQIARNLERTTRICFFFTCLVAPLFIVSSFLMVVKSFS